MMTAVPATRPLNASQPAWEIARLFPDQGDWSEAEYLALGSNRIVELSDGFVEVLPLPTEEHQDIAGYLYGRLFSFVEAGRLGKVLFAPMPVKLWAEKIREPDVLFMKVENAARRSSKFWSGADLAMEVVSPDDRGRDFDVKRKEYARGAIPEYWIVDPEVKEITVLKLVGELYDVAGLYHLGESAASVLLTGFAVDVTDVFSPK